MAVKDIAIINLGATIALLDKWYPGTDLHLRVLKGIKIAKRIWEMADIAEDGGDNINIDDLKSTINVDIVAQTLAVLEGDLYSVGGTGLTARDISGRGLCFIGAVYENENTATDDTARRFETTSLKLRDVIIEVDTKDQLFGNSSNQRYKVAAGEAFGFTQVDISTLYFKNATAGQNGTVRILAVTDAAYSPK